MNKLMIALYLLLIAPSAFCDALGSLYHLQNCLTELERLNGQLRSAAAQRSTTQAFKDSQIASLQSAFATTLARCRTLAKQSIIC